MSRLTDRLTVLNKNLVSFINSVARNEYPQYQLAHCHDLLKESDLSSEVQEELTKFSKETYDKMVTDRAIQHEKDIKDLLNRQAQERESLTKTYIDKTEELKKFAL